MNYHVKKSWDLPQKSHTPPDVYENRKQHRREFLKMMGITSLTAGLSPLVVGCQRASEEEVQKAGAVETLSPVEDKLYPAIRNKAFEYGRPETAKRDAAEYTNFYEFSSGKDSWRYVEKFQPRPWQVKVSGLCAKPVTLDLDDMLQKFTLEERAYRHRCVETWAMCVPWTGFPLAELLKMVEPKPTAKYVQFETFERPNEAPAMKAAGYPWPYTEGLTIDEAMNPLALLATGIYGEPLPKQHGAPVRLVVPWKYGFKSGKSITNIRLVERKPDTFWTTLAAHEYSFQANVEPDVPHPRWSQQSEWMLGSRERHPTVIYNGYGDYVGHLYKG